MTENLSMRNGQGTQRALMAETSKKVSTHHERSPVSGAQRLFEPMLASSSTRQERSALCDLPSPESTRLAS